MGMVSLSLYAQKMNIAYMTAWKWYKSGRLEGSCHGPDGIMVPEELLPSKIDDAIEVINLAEYARRNNIEYHQARLDFLAGKIPNSFHSPGRSLMVMIFEKEES